MTEFAFYHLTRHRVDQALVQLLAASAARSMRVRVQTGAPDQLAGISDKIWLAQDEGFPAHGLEGGAHDAEQPVLMGAGNEPLNAAEVLMLIQNAPLDTAAAGAYKKVMRIFDGGSDAELNAARADWKTVKDAGLTGVYWSQENGKWEEKART